MTPARLTGGAGFAIVVAIVVAAFLSIGPPSRARAEALDRQRLRDLGDIAANLHDDYTDGGKLLPPALTAPKRDPTTGKSYDYRRLTSERYQLCATFELAAPQGRNDAPLSSFWHHPSGHYCYQLDIRARVESTL